MIDSVVVSTVSLMLVPAGAALTCRFSKLPPVADAMVRLTGLAGRAAYAPADPQPADADAAAAAAETTLRDLQRGTPLGRRILGWYLPERSPD